MKFFEEVQRLYEAESTGGAHDCCDVWDAIDALGGLAACLRKLFPGLNTELTDFVHEVYTSEFYEEQGVLRLLENLDTESVSRIVVFRNDDEQLEVTVVADESAVVEHVIKNKARSLDVVGVVRAGVSIQ